MRLAAAIAFGLLGAANAQVSLADVPALARARAQRQRPQQQKALEPFLHDLSLEFGLNREIVEKAINGAAALGDAIAPLLLEHMTPKEDSQEARNLSQNAARVLKLLDPSGFTDALIEIAAGRSETGRIWAIWLLGCSKSPSAAPALASLLTHLNGRERSQAIESLAALAYAPATAQVLPFLQSQDPRQRQAALGYLTAVRAQAAIEPALAAMAKEIDADVVMRYVTFLQVTAQDHPAAAQALLPLLADDGHARTDKDQQAEVVKALATVAPKRHEPTLKALKAILDKQEVGKLGIAAAVTMRDLGDKKGIEVLTANLDRYVNDHRRESLAYTIRGDAHLALERFELAIRDYREALKLSSSQTQQTMLWLSIAQAEVKRERWPQVKQALIDARVTFDQLQREAMRRPELVKAMQNETVRKYVESLKK